jgi:hypothetical protein
MPNTTGANDKASRRRARTRRLALTAAVSVAALLGLAQGAQAAQAGSAPQVATLGWHLQNPPNPTGSIGSDLSDVSCSASGACTAVGSYESSGSVFTTFAERWNGSTWTIENTPEATSSNLNGVACLSATDCVAVGDILTGVDINTATLAEVWNGSTWTTQSTPTPASATRAFLIDVACTAANQCTAAGSYYNKSGHELLFAERWNGTSWKIETTPQPSGAKISQFNGVSCASATSCIAVGSTSEPTDNMLAEIWNGTSWTLMSTPNPAGGSSSYLGSVSCTAVAACTATGDYYNGSVQASLAERWNGTTWTAQTTVNRPGATDTDLVGDSCVTASHCVSVGGNFKNGNTRAIAEHWDGSSWTIKHVGAPSGSTESALVSVSCPTTTDCTAVGFWANGTGTDIILAEQYSP